MGKMQLSNVAANDTHSDHLKKKIIAQNDKFRVENTRTDYVKSSTTFNAL